MIADFVAAAATLWQYWNNPFLIRGFRSDWRGRSWVAAFILQFGVLASIVWIIGAIGSMAGPRGFAEWWGGSWGGLAIVLMSLAHFFMVRRGAAANRRLRRIVGMRTHVQVPARVEAKRQGSVQGA